MRIMDLQLTGRIAVVTGGSRGIGKAVARALADEGVDVALVARGATALDEAAAELSAATGRRVVGVAADTTDPGSVAAMAAEVAQQLGPVGILVNAAARPSGQAPPTRWDDVDRHEAMQEFDTKVLGYLRCAQALAPGMVAAGWGRIINISGLGARTTGNVLGSMRNVAVAAMTKNLADDLGPRGVNVTVVHPGLTRTEATPGVIASRVAATGRSAADIEQAMGSVNTLGRLIDAWEVAAVVTFLASPLSVAINGDAIAAGGGMPGVITY
jgi:NAD(P)-dependent dehydrogenase (short-subunit alcohol dehydrogenase family)